VASSPGGSSTPYQHSGAPALDRATVSTLAAGPPHSYGGARSTHKGTGSGAPSRRRHRTTNRRRRGVEGGDRCGPPR